MENLCLGVLIFRGFSVPGLEFRTVNSYAMLSLDMRLKTKTLKKAVLIFAMIILLLSGMVPFLSVWIK